MWNGGTEVDEGWEGYDGDDDKNDMPLKKLYVPKQRPDFPHYILKKICVSPYRPDFSHLFGRKLFYRTVYYVKTMLV